MLYKKESVYQNLRAMLARGIHLASANKILSEMGNFDTMNTSDYLKDIYYLEGGYWEKI